MSLKNIVVKSVFTATTILSFSLNANATWKYSGGIGYGIGLVKFNDDKNDSAFKGDVKPTLDANVSGATIAPNGSGTASLTNLTNAKLAGVVGQGDPVLRTTYKYVENLPQRILHLELGATKSFENINLMNRNFFAGAVFGVGFGKINASKGITNLNGKYMSTGSTALFWSLNAKFGLENSMSKVYGLLGLTYAKVDLPYDILPFGDKATLGDLNTQIVMQDGSSLLATVSGANITSTIESSTLCNDTKGCTITIPIKDSLASINQKASAKIKVKDASTSLWFINIGGGLEVNMTEKLVLFAEYTHLMQLNRGKDHSISYEVDGKSGTFKGVIHSTNSDYIKAGLRYYFN